MSSARSPDEQMIAACSAHVHIRSHIGCRYERGQPSSDLGKAGVLVHVFDQFENWRDDRPWEMHADQSYDHWPCSVINRGQCAGAKKPRPISRDLLAILSDLRLQPRPAPHRPNVYPHGNPFDAGLLFGTSARVLCGYSGDAGSGLRTRGGCPQSWAALEQHTGGGRTTPLTLERAMRAVPQKNGYYVGFNEVIVGDREWYERALPGVVDAVLVFSWSSGAAIARAKKVHASFLQAFGLTSAQVPLVQYRFDAYQRPMVPARAFELVDTT